MLNQSSVESVTHVIQVALTPVFLLTAVAALLNVFSTRLGRVADRVHQVSANLQSSMTTDAHLLLKYLRRRSLVLDVAVVLATIAGMATSGAALPVCRCVGRGGCQVHAVRSFRRRNLFHHCGAVYVCHRNDDGWARPPGFRPQTAEEDRRQGRLRSPVMQAAQSAVQIS